MGSPNGLSALPFRPDKAALPLDDGNTMHLHATDPGLGEAGEWTIGVADGGIAWSHEHGKGTVALRGDATELLLAIAATSAGRRYRHRGVRRRRRVAKVAGSHTAVARGDGNLQAMTTSEIATVLAWHDALNTSDLDTLATLSSDDIDMGDAHGAAQGHEALRRWASLPSGDDRARPDVRARRGRGRRTKAPRLPTHPALAFRVVHDHVTSVFRHHDLASALDATGLSEADLVT